MINFVEKQVGKTSIIKGECIDISRNNRVIPYKIYLNEQVSPKKRPVIIWSHGLGGGRDGAGFISRFLAEYGYIVIHIQHAGTDTTMWEGKPGHPWDVIRATEVTRDMTLDRYQDVPFLLSQLPSIEQSNDLVKGCVDYDRIGMSGHSFGALTSQVMSGQLFPDKDDTLVSYKQDVFKASIFYSFSAMSHLDDTDPQTMFGEMTIPMFFMTGTEDDSPISGQDYRHRLPAYNCAGSDEKHVLVIQDGDHMVFTGSRGKLAFNPKREIQEELIQYSSLAFWEVYLNDNAAAKAWLNGQGFRNYLSDNGQYCYRDEI